MKLRSILFFAALLLTAFQSNAQLTGWIYDSLQTGPTYGKDNYYKMSGTGPVKTDTNTTWHLAFEMLPGGPGFGGVSVLANHSQGKVKVYSVHKASSNFSSLSTSDTAGKTILYNADSNWHWGALNQNHDATDMFNYGWGVYNQTTHFVEGDSIYLVTVDTGAPATTVIYKVHISHYHSTPSTSIYYAFHVATFDNSVDFLDTVWRSNGHADKNFAYYNLFTKNDFDHEPTNKSWDWVYTRYVEFLSFGPGPKLPQTSTGMLQNLSTNVAEVRPVTPDTTVSFNSYPYSTVMNTIGQDWKVMAPSPAPPGTFVVDTTVTYFIKTIDTAVYQMKFLSWASGAGPTGTGKVVFAKRMWQLPATVDKITNNIQAHTLAPNPAVNEATMVLDAKETAANSRLLITDITGKTIQNSTITINKGLNAFSINTSNFAAGTYFITVTNGSWKVTDKLIIQH